MQKGRFGRRAIHRVLDPFAASPHWIPYWERPNPTRFGYAGVVFTFPVRTYATYTLTSPFWLSWQWAWQPIPLGPVFTFTFDVVFDQASGHVFVNSTIDDGAGNFISAGRDTLGYPYTWQPRDCGTRGTLGVITAGPFFDPPALFAPSVHWADWADKP